MQYELDVRGSDKYYILTCYDGPIRFECKINTLDNADDVTHFETNYKDYCNDAIVKRDPTTKAPLYKRGDVSKHLFANYSYFTTYDANSLDAANSDYDIALTGDTVTTVIYNPEASYWMEGGSIQLVTPSPTCSCKTVLTLAPDIPVESGGSVVLINNKKFDANLKTFEIEGYPQYVEYNSEAPLANKLELKITHDAECSLDFEICLKCFK